jgi:hypothetical protein
MQIAWAGLYPGGVRGGGLDHPEGTISEIDLRTVASSAEPTPALCVAWRCAKEPDDHPNLGSVVVLVHPDGQSQFVGAMGYGGWAGEMSQSVAIQASTFRGNGAHAIEIRPSQMNWDDPTAIEASGERRLAILPLFVTGVR